MKRPSFLAVKLAQVLCVVYILVLTFSFAPVGLRDRASGNIIDASNPQNTEDGVLLVNGNYRPVVAQGTFELVCLGISRMSAFSLYPVMVLAYLSKCKATLNFLEKTPLSMFMIKVIVPLDCDYITQEMSIIIKIIIFQSKDDHKLHIYCGRFIAFDVWIHTLFHLLRWGHHGNIKLLWTSAAGLSGLITVVATPFITVIMHFKTTISYEIRKGLHYLFFLFAIAMCFHVPPSGIPNGGFIAYVLGFSIAMYTLDRLYIVFFMTERVEPKFQVLPCGVQMNMVVSDRFQRCGEKGGFVYVCLPWIDRQWHAFSLFQDPSDSASRGLFILNVGNWSHAVHTELQRSNTSRPVWIRGPFVSPYRMARDFDNQILVSTGIGITPALSVIEAHKESRTIFLVWSTRDASMVEFFLENYHYLDHQYGFNFIYYTGQTLLNPTLIEGLASNIKIIYSRPNLEIMISNIIHASECSGTKSHDNFQSCHKCQVIQGLLEKSKELDIQNPEISPQSDEEKLEGLMAWEKDAGYDISQLSIHFKDAGISCPFTSPKTTKSHRSQIAPNFPNDEAMVFDANASMRFKRIRRYADVWNPTLHATRSVKKMEHKSSLLSRWGVMYCGGSAQVKGTLKQISKEYGVDLHYESFAW
ncbi:hypothetical protein ACHAXR_008944 [Thalassiosira sp. AJA248-18]